MKKTILLLAFSLSLLTACSSDETKTEYVQVPVAATNQMKVLQMGAGSAPGGPMFYSINYGTSQEDQVYIEVSEAVYNHYYAQWQVASNPRWRGEVTD